MHLYSKRKDSFYFLFLLTIMMFVSSIGILNAQEEKLDFTIEDAFERGIFFGQPFQGGAWADEGPIITYIDRSRETGATNIVSYNLEEDEYTTILDGSNLHAADVDRLINIEEYQYSSDKTKVLLYTDSAPVWRLNTKGFYYIYDIDEETLTPIGSRDKGYQLFAKFSPDGKYVGFVRKRNLFVVEIETMSEIQLTTNGSENGIINGTSDWVYEEEFFLRDGWAWSPDSKYISFVQLDETEVSEYNIINYLPHKPTILNYKYPFAGEKNSNIRVGLIDMTTKEIDFLETDTWLPDNEENEYIPRFGWTPEINGKSYCWMFRMNRDQNRLDLLYADPATGNVKVTLSEDSETWVEIEFNNISKIYFLNDNEHFIWLSDKDGWAHLYLYKNSGEYVRQITKGNWEVTAYHGADLDEGLVYFNSTAETPVERHLYSVGLLEDTGEPLKITEKSGWHAVDMSSDFKYYVDSYSTHENPRIVTLHRNNGQIVKTLVDNAPLFETIEQFNMPDWEFFTVPGADGTELHAFMMKPHDFDPNKKYPLLMYQYGGPGGQSVNNQFDPFFGMFHSYIVESLDMIVACVDNRGTPGYGKKFLSANYKAVGTLDPEDQIAVAKQWGDLPYIDKEKIGIWGWSYGGYNAYMSMVKYDGPSTFKYGIGIAPGGEEDLYDTIYTERYMLTPQKNPDGYAESSPINFVDGLADHQRLLIIHSDMDDNLHYQCTVRLISALQKAKKQFDMMIYPGGNHSLRGTGNRFVFSHLFTMMSNYIKRANNE
ncbi:S9 family peptidase [Bacteroidota bacterium]